MFKLKKDEYKKEMGFVTSDIDYVYRGKNATGGVATLFTIYKGSPYIRTMRTGYVLEQQLYLIYEWTKKDYIEWEDQKEEEKDEYL